MKTKEEHKQDDRFERIQEQLLKFTQMDFTSRTPLSGKGDELDAIIVGMNTLGEEMETRSFHSLDEEKRITALSEALLKYTLMDFSEKILVTEKGDELDAIAVGLNTLSEELESNIQKLKENEDKYRMLFNSIDEGYCIIEMIFDDQNKPIDYRFLEINASFEKQTGLSDAVGKRMREFAPDHEEYWFETYGKIALTGESVRFENRAEQLHRWYDVYAFRFGDPKNMQVAILFNDVTERKQTEGQLQSVNKELEAFSYSVSHDLRAPLRAVNGYAQMLNEDYGTQLDDEGKRIIETIRYNAAKMGALIDDLLAFSRLGRKEVQTTRIDMNELTEGVLIEINKLGLNHAKINIGKLHQVKADYSLLHQVMFNLVSNAIKYSAKKKDPTIEITSEENNSEIIFSVKDNGAGFDMKYYNKLFGVFQRLHTQDEFEGTGVGLAIIQRIIAKHGGKVRAEGKVNEGAIFHFTLPKDK